MLTVDKVRNVIHRSRTVKRIHGNQVFESRRLQFPKVFLHARRLKLEGSDGTSVTVQAISCRIVNRNLVNVQHNSLAVFNIFEGFLDNRQGLQAQKIHLDQSGILNNRTFILRYEHLFARFLIISRTYGNPVGYIVPTDDCTASMYTRVADISLQHLGVLDGIPQDRIGRNLSSLQFGYIRYGIRQVQFLVGYLVRYQLTEAV